MGKIDQGKNSIHDCQSGDDVTAGAEQGSSASEVPAQLPLDIPGFTGRRAALSRLNLLAHDDATDIPKTVVITAIQGMPGVGKTSLAVHWAHSVAHRFPDGQLYLDLGGHSTRGVVTVADALGHILRGLGVDGTKIPADENERAAVYRSAISGRRVLVVLDNAASAEQVRPLIPGSPTCLVIVTSRNQLVGLVAYDGARPIDLDVLSVDEALALITIILGRKRAEDEINEVRELARLCSYLPLALRVAAADLAARPHDSVASVVRELTTDRLGALTIEEDPRSAVQAAFELSFQRLDDDAKTSFRRLGLLEGPDFTPGAVAALLQCPAEDAQRDLRKLARASLVEGNRPGRYRIHDLLHEYARILLESSESDGSRREAVGNLLAWYLARSRGAARVLHPHRRALAPPTGTPEPDLTIGYADALAWFENERGNLVAAIGQAEELGLDEFIWEMADAIYDFLDLRSYHQDNIDIHRAGLVAATRHGNRLARAYMLQHLAVIDTHRGRYREAIDHAKGALAELRELDDPYAESAPLNALARIYLRLGRFPEALENGQAALQIRHRIGDRRGEAETLDNLVSLSWRLSRYDDALRDSERALKLWREIGDLRGESEALTNLATVQASVGESPQALITAADALKAGEQVDDQYAVANALATLSNICRRVTRYKDSNAYAGRCLAIRQKIGDRRGEAAILVNNGKVYTETGYYTEAFGCLRKALTIQRDIGDRQGEGETLCETAYVYWRRGRYSQALDHLNRALEIQRKLGDRSGEAETLDLMGRVYRRSGDLPAALSLAETSLQIRRDIGDRSGEAESLGGIARVQRRLGEHAAALENAYAALEIFSAIGFRRGEAAARDNIGRIKRHMAETGSALQYAQEAVAISREVGHRYDESLAHDGLARIWLEAGDTAESLVEGTAALALEHELGNLYGAAQTLCLLCLIHERLGKVREAAEYGTQAAHVFHEMSDAEGESAALALVNLISAPHGDSPAQET